MTTDIFLLSLLPAGFVALVAAWFWFSARSRTVRGMTLRPAPPDHPDFLERRASGTARGGGNARNCLIVCVAGGELFISPSFPLNLMAPYGWLGLEHRVPVGAVTRAEKRKSLFSTFVQIQIAAPGASRPRVLDLTLKNPDGFLAAIGK